MSISVSCRRCLWSEMPKMHRKTWYLFIKTFKIIVINTKSTSRHLDLSVKARPLDSMLFLVWFASSLWRRLPWCPPQLAKLNLNQAVPLHIHTQSTWMFSWPKMHQHNHRLHSKLCIKCLKSQMILRQTDSCNLINTHIHTCIYT